MMKVIRLIFSVSLLVCGLTSAFAQSFSTNAIGGAEYEFAIIEGGNSEVALIKGVNKGASRMEIPASVAYNGVQYRVTVMASYSLRDCDEKLRELIIPSSVREIESSLFVNTSTGSKIGTILAKYYTLGIAGSVKRKSPLNDVELTNLHISKNVEKIGDKAFLTLCNLVSKKKNMPMKAHISELPDFITVENAEQYGLSQAYVSEYRNGYSPIPPSPNNPGPVILAPDISGSKPVYTQSDIDQNIPQNPTTNTKTFAVIIANETYQHEAKVDFATNDGKSFKTYCQSVLGLPESNIHYVENATLNNIIFELDWLNQVSEAYKGTASIIIYYSGHGIPDEANHKAYLLPIDGSGKNVRTCYALDDFYKAIGGMQAKHVTVFLDACFSGAKRDGDMQTAARGVAIRARASAPKGNMLVVSAAQGDQTAYAYKEQKHGLFTYFLLKKMKESGGNATLGEIVDYVKDNVNKTSVVVNTKPQNPTATASPAMGQSWRNKKLK